MKNWRTTLMGLVGAIGQVVAGSQATGGKLDWRTLAGAAGTLLLGLVAGDSKNTQKPQQ